MSFESWMQAQSEYTPLSPSAAFAAGRAEAEAEMRSPGPCGIQGHMNADWVRNVSSIQGDRDYCQLCAKNAEITALKAENIRLDAEWKQAHQTNSNLLTERFQLKADLTKAIRLAADYGIDRDRLREALLKAAIPLEALRCQPDKSRYLSDEVQHGILEATNAIRALVSAPASGQERKPT